MKIKREACKGSSFFSFPFPLILIIFFVSALAACTLGQTPPGSGATQPSVVMPVIGVTSPGQEAVPGEPVELVAPQPQAGDTRLWVDGGLLVYIPPGEFIMGNDRAGSPQHVVSLDGFWIYRTEVTNSMYLRCMLMEECSPPVVDLSLPNLEDPALADLPVVGLRWEQAERYCRFVGGNLPTEAQWEKTARGPQGNIHPWGNEEPVCDLLNFNNCLGETSPVIAYPSGASYYGVLDMAGNVFEWVADWYQEDYYARAPYDNPPGPEASPVRSVRGSTYETQPDQVESALRYFLGPDEYRSDLGFRCVVANAHEFAPPCEVLAYVSPDVSGAPGSGPGGSAACVVPQPELEVVTYCENRLRGNNISWTPADAELDYSTHEGATCMQYDTDTLACGGPVGSSVFIKVCKSCPPPAVDLGVPGSCEPPYVLDASTGLCKYAGLPLPGANLCAPHYSLLSQQDTVCCEMQQGSPADYPACAPGGSYEATSRICWYRLPSTGDEKCDSEMVTFEPCERTGGSDSSDGLDGSDGPCPPGFFEYCFATGSGMSCVCVQ